MPDDVLDNEEIQEFDIDELLETGEELYGPYESHLYTEGNEFWLEDAISLEHAQANGHLALNDGNSYTGWYHVRNANTSYQLLVPTKENEDDYDGPVMFAKRKWFMSKGLLEIANHSSLSDAPSIRGCTNPEAWNYNPLATEDDGSCWIVPGYFLGQIPPQKMTNLHTTGGELTHSETMMQYQGYYHVHSAGDLPVKPGGGHVSPGAIYTGKDWTGDNILLWPVHVEGRFLQERDGIDVTEMEDTNTFKVWHDIIANAASQHMSIEENLNSGMNTSNITIEVDTTSTGQGKDFIAFDNIISFPNAVAIMNELDYQFNFLIDDPDRSPGIYGMKPKLTSDVNIINFSEEDLGADPGDGVDYTQGPGDEDAAIGGVGD